MPGGIVGEVGLDPVGGEVQLTLWIHASFGCDCLPGAKLETSASILLQEIRYCKQNSSHFVNEKLCYHVEVGG